VERDVGKRIRRVFGRFAVRSPRSAAAWPTPVKCVAIYAGAAAFLVEPRTPTANVLAPVGAGGTVGV
jgi:hypothetical protein